MMEAAMGRREQERRVGASPKEFRQGEQRPRKCLRLSSWALLTGEFHLSPLLAP